MRTAKKLLAALICIALISGFSAPVLAANTTHYTLAIPCQFDEYAGQFRGGLAVVRKGGKAGLIDKAGHVIVPFEYDGIFSMVSVSDINFMDDYFTVLRNGKFGVIDKSGKLVIPLEYDSIFSGGPGFAILGKGRPVPPGGWAIEGLWGLYDLKTGKEILPVKYKYISPSDDASLYIVNQENKTGVTDRTGKFIVPIGTYDFISNFNLGFAQAQKNGLWGVIDQSGKVIIPFEYNSINHISKGVILAVKGNKLGVLNTSGQTVIPYNYDDGGMTANGLIYMRQSSTITIFNSTGNIIIPPGKYDSFHGTAGNLMYVGRGGKVGAIDMAGQEVVPFVYTGVRETKNGLAVVTNNDKCAVINRIGKVILPLDKYGVVNLQDDGCILVASATNYRYGLKDYDGRTILANEYHSIGPMNDGYVTVSNEKGTAVFNKDGDMIVPFGAFDYIDYHISENMVAVIQDGLTGYISLPEYIAPPDSWAKPEVDRAVAAGLIPEDMRRDYQDNITRADFCRLAVNLIEVKTGMQIDVFLNTRGMSGCLSDPIAFIDTEDPVILAASRLGIVKGIGANKFDPAGSIKRQDAAVMLQQTARVLDFTEPNGTPETFADTDQFSRYAVDAIAFVSAAADKESGIKVMSGTGHNNFSPTATYTRQQAYLTILRLYNAM